MKMSINKTLIIILSLTIFLTSFTLAIFPGIPHQFYGNVIMNGIPVTSGTVEVAINGKFVKSTPISSGKYGYDPLFLIQDPEYTFNGKLITFYVNGKLITFYVNGIEVTTYIFENGGITNLDLIFNYSGYCGNGILEDGEECDDGILNGILCDNSNSSCTYCNSLCELITLPYEEQDKKTKSRSAHIGHVFQYCDVNWECSGWGVCVDGSMTRECYDTNNCENKYNKPNEITGCEIISHVLVEEKNPYAFLLIGFGIAIALLIILIIILSII